MSQETRKVQLDGAIKVLQAKKHSTTAHHAPTPTKITDKTIYLNVDCQGMSGVQHLIKADMVKKVGITNFDGKQLSSGRNLVIDGFKTVFSTAGEKIQNVKWNTSETLPAELLNAEIRLTQGNDELIDMPMSDTQGFKNDDFRSISTTPLLRSKEDFNLDIEFPDGVTVPAGKPAFLSIMFRVTHAKQ